MSERLGHNPNQISLKEKDYVVTLMQREQKAWGLKDIPPPPDTLFEVLNRANEKGYTTLEPHYLPERKFAQDSKWPGLGIKPKDYFWQCIRQGELPKDANQLYDMWFLIDNIRLHPEYINANELGSVVERLRNEGKIYVPSTKYYVGCLPRTSRLGISWDELHDAVNPAIAEMLGVQKEMSRLPRLIERNIIANLHHPEWGKLYKDSWGEIVSKWEWIEDILPLDDATERKRMHSIWGSSANLFQPTYTRLICGNTKSNKDFNYGCISDFLYEQSNNKSTSISFRPMIVFPTNIIARRKIQQQLLSPVFSRI